MLKFILEKLINSFNEKYDDYYNYYQHYYYYHYWYDALALRSALHSWNRGSQVGSVMWPRCDCHSCEEFHRKSVQRWVLDSCDHQNDQLTCRNRDYSSGTLLFVLEQQDKRVRTRILSEWTFFSASVGPNCHSVPPQHRCEHWPVSGCQLMIGGCCVCRLMSVLLCVKLWVLTGVLLFPVSEEEM